MYSTRQLTPMNYYRPGTQRSSSSTHKNFTAGHDTSQFVISASPLKYAVA